MLFEFQFQPFLVNFMFISNLPYTVVFSPCPARMGKAPYAPPRSWRSQLSKPFSGDLAALSMLHLTNNKPERQPPKPELQSFTKDHSMQSKNISAGFMSSLSYLLSVYFHLLWCFTLRCTVSCLTSSNEMYPMAFPQKPNNPITMGCLGSVEIVKIDR